MQIKSIEELKKIREKSLKKVNLREHGEESGDQIEVLVGMATCGIASGARETLSAIVDQVSKENLENVKIIPVGCIGYCHSEPIVQLNIPGQNPILYGKVDGEKGREIVKKHIKGGEPLKESIIDASFDRA
ncbi:(2Fe-2S) ferredoxin domain-containing protein [Marinisporobacter balticus]|uniref:NAD(P)-dependent iron-only hydrogenase iron-sulfur protein n=1 Tax=Marinisporobacter balticus TaxID=2018667 RepID=A0A4R2KGC6_9FIRM|nr:(2Fe-2S) ferredoxin domain-containing protein [Marinisporobacter balticus]TCO72653.1 NAD(P)-dependent iron-only hydrogenase iron-sulfur protein [Marinisporobacter balticus]